MVIFVSQLLWQYWKNVAWHLQICNSCFFFIRWVNCGPWASWEYCECVLVSIHLLGRLLLNHWVEFNQNCFMTTAHGKGVREQHLFFFFWFVSLASVWCPSSCHSHYLLLLYLFGYKTISPSDWRPGGRGFNPRRGRQYSFMEIDHEIFSTVILSLPLIQEGQLSVSGERMCTILVSRSED